MQDDEAENQVDSGSESDAAVGSQWASDADGGSKVASEEAGGAQSPSNAAGGFYDEGWWSCTKKGKDGGAQSDDAGANSGSNASERCEVEFF